MKKFFLLFILSAVLMLSGCNNSGIPVSKQTLTPTGITNLTSTPVPTVEVKRSVLTCQVISQSQLPTNFPSDITYPDGAKLVAVSCPADTDNFLVTFNIMAFPDDIYAKLETQLKSLGWEISASSMLRDNYASYIKYHILIANKGSRSVIYDIRQKTAGVITEVLIRERL
jgi:hypothetical protein